MANRLLVLLPLLSISVMGSGQILPAHRGLIPNPLSAQQARMRPPTPKETQRSVAGFMQAQARGRFNTVVRTAFYNPNVLEWLPDSSWLSSDYDLLPFMGVPTQKLLGTVGYNYTTIGDSIKAEWFPDGGATNRDTLARTWNYTGGTWTMTSRTRWKFRTDFEREVAEYPGVLGQLEVQSTTRRHTYRDALNRPIAHTDSNFSAFNGYWAVTMDSLWYAGAAARPFRVHGYAAGDSGRPYLAIVQDSLRYDANGEFAYMFEYDYGPDGALVAQDRQTRAQRGDTVVVTSDRTTTSSLGNPTRFYISETSITCGDSIVNLTYMVQSDGHQIFRRAVTRYTLPPNYPRNWGYDYVQVALDSAAGVWRTYDRGRAVPEIGLGGEPQRILYFAYDASGDSLLPSWKQAYEAYSMDLITALSNSGSKQILVSPNPASGSVSISGIPAADQVVLAGALGQSHSIPCRENMFDIASLPPGLYQATFYRNGASVGTARLVKQ